MKVDTTYSKLFRAFITIVPISVLVYIVGYYFLNPDTGFRSDYSCTMTARTDKYCNYTCIFATEKDANARILVTHTAWASIYEHRFNTTAYQPVLVEIQLPNRNHSFYLRGAFWRNVSINYVHQISYEYSTIGGSLQC